MSFFNQVLSKIGIGAAKVDTFIKNPNLSPGDTLCGHVWVEGGNAAQEINEITLNLMCAYTKKQHIESDEGDTEIIKEPQTHRLCSYVLGETWTIHPGEQRTIPFEMPLPAHTPLSVGEGQVWVDTHLDIDFALDQNDQDVLDVQPNLLQQSVFNTMRNLGFTFHESDCEAGVLMHNQPTPFVQEFEFKPMTSALKRQLDEVELVWFPNADGSLNLLLEIDRKTQGLLGRWFQALDWDETKCHLRLYPNQINQVQILISDLIAAHS